VASAENPAMERALLIASFALVASCGSDDEPPTDAHAAAADAAVVADAPIGGVDATGEPDAAAADAGAPDAGPGALCTFLVNEGPWIESETVNEDPPHGTGGTIADGTYRLTRYQVYVGPDGAAGTASARIALRFSPGHHFEWITEHSVLTGFAASGSYSTAGVSMFPENSCNTQQGPGLSTHEYTATENEYKLYTAALVLTMTRQTP
jgi:hypothetical protein